MKIAGSIRQLDPSVVNRIAAGEAISCPSNAIKELIENSIDADSSKIIIEVDRGGYDLIRIIDDGCGFNRIDLPIACKAHTTSKISEYSDLQKISTFGFRGEALHSISMVTHLKITTMTDKDEFASVACYEEGELQGPINAASAIKGTTIEARNLFFNYTMRLQGINPTAEAKKITDIVSKYSVIYPQISFTVRCNRKETLMTFGNMSSSETVLKLLYGFDDVSFFRCNFDLSNGVYVNLFLSEPNSKVKKKTNALFINGRLVKNDSLTKGVEEAYTKNSGLGGCGSLQFCFITMAIPPSNIDVNIHPKKEKVKFLNEKKIINDICERVKEIVLEHSKKTNSNSKPNSIYDSFFKNSKSKTAVDKNQTILQAFCSSDKKNDEVAIVSQADANDTNFSTKNFDNSDMDSVLNSEKSIFSLDLRPSINPSVSHISSRAPTLTPVKQPSPQKKIEELKKYGNKNYGIDDEDIDGDTVVISSLPTVSSSSTSPVRSSLFAAFNSKPKEAFSQLPIQIETNRKENTTKIIQSQKTSPNSKRILLDDDDELDKFDVQKYIITSKNQMKLPSSLTIAKDQDNQITTKPNNLSVIEKKSINQPSSSIISKAPVENNAENTQDILFRKKMSRSQIEETEKINEAEQNKASSSLNDIIKTTEKIQSPTKISQDEIRKQSTARIPLHKMAENNENDMNNTEFPIKKNENDMNQTSENKEGISLFDLINNDENAQVMNDLPSFSPLLQKKAIERIEKKNVRSGESSSKSKEKPKKAVKSIRSVFDDLKYDPTNGCQSLNIQSQSQSRNRNRQEPSNDSSMKKLEDLFSNVGDNMKRKFRVVNLSSILSMRKRREETADLELKRLFHSKRMKLVGFMGTKNVIFTAPTIELLDLLESKEYDDDIGLTPIKEENNAMYVFNLFALMKDLLRHKFLDLFSNLPTFNVEINIEEITNPVKKSSPNRKTITHSTKKSIQERFDELIGNSNINKVSHFFDDDEMKKSAKDCLEEKKDMLLDYFSIFYKNGMIKTMPDVIRGYRPSFSSFPLFLEKLISEVDWEDEMNCFETLIDQLAQLYSILPNDENPKVANNLLLQFKTAILPELSDEGYSPNITLRESGSFISTRIPHNNR